MREPLDLTPDEKAEERTFHALYGPWDAFDLDGVRDFFDGFDRPWWLVGGWSIEAFTGALREHEDMDVSLLACDVPAFREFVGDRCAPVDQRERPAPASHRPVARSSAAGLPDLGTAEATSPWVLDIALTPDADGMWRSKRMPEHVAPLDDVTWVTDEGVRVADPEIVLLYKAAGDRRKDRRDLARASAAPRRAAARLAG